MTTMKTGKIYFLTLALLLFFTFKLRAQNDTIWSLEKCIQYALENNIQIKQQTLDEDISDVDLRQSEYNFYPGFNADFSHGYSFGRSVDPFTNEFATERIMRQDGRISGSVVLFSGFTNVNNLRLNMHLNTAVRYDTEKIQNDVTLTIAAAYMQILYSMDFVENAVQQVEIIKQQLERTRLLFEGGTVPRGSVMEIEARLAEEELNLVNARNDLRLSYLELIHLLDMDASVSFAIEKPDIEIEDQLNLSSHQNIFEQALAVEPSIQSAEEYIEVASKQLELEKGGLYPTVSLVGSLGSGFSQAAQIPTNPVNLGPMQIGYLQDGTEVFADNVQFDFDTKPYSDQLRDNFYQYVGVNVSIPIFNRMQTRSRIQRSRIELERARNNYELSQNNLNKTIGQAYADALAAYQRYQATNKALDSFNESFNYTRQRFELGMVSTVEFNESQMRLAQAQRDAIQAKYDFVFKKKIMEFYTGKGFEL